MAEIYDLVFLRDSFKPASEANLGITSSAILYGISTYSVIPIFLSFDQKKLNPYRLEDHYKRLLNSSKILGLTDFNEKWTLSKFKKVIIEILQKNDLKSDSLLRIMVFADGNLAGAKMQGVAHETAMFVYPMEQMHPASGISLMVSSWRRNPDNAIPSRAKVSGGYINVALMKNEALSFGFDDAIALDDQGHVTESTVSNIFLVEGNKLITPSSSSDLLEGLTRNTVFLLAKKLKLEVVERTVDRSELYIADEVFLCGSSMSIVPVTQIDKRNISSGRTGEITLKLIEEYNNLVRSNNAKNSVKIDD